MRANPFRNDSATLTPSRKSNSFNDFICYGVRNKEILPSDHSIVNRQYKESQLFFGQDGLGFFGNNPAQKEQLYFGTDSSGFFKSTLGTKKQNIELQHQFTQPKNYQADFAEFHRFHSENHKLGYIL